MTLFRPGGRCSFCGNDPSNIPCVISPQVEQQTQEIIDDGLARIKTVLDSVDLSETKELIILGKILKKFLEDSVSHYRNCSWIQKTEQFNRLVLDGQVEDLTEEEIAVVNKCKGETNSTGAKP